MGGTSVTTTTTVDDVSTTISKEMALKQVRAWLACDVITMDDFSEGNVSKETALRYVQSWIQNDVITTADIVLDLQLDLENKEDAEL
jgi:hypothetical protein